ncbi:hypothetical protein [Agrococcus sp. ARC_14]|uniref:hypothetical protein n=1 Tax=Agrococcus sp. ARC_14 TaxID=2919927 RepID=UPI001F066915|nr:hypothetical protein [Agrococcus sp. ARC_14]MCH1881868.1 hypothetical protein [Agrococcus sp. ARC_14]
MLAIMPAQPAVMAVLLHRVPMSCRVARERCACERARRAVAVQRKPATRMLRRSDLLTEIVRDFRATGLRCAARYAFSASFHFTIEPVFSSDRS